MMRLLGMLCFVVLAASVAAFAVANRAPLRISLDPLPLSLELPVYALGLGGIAVGIVIGGAIGWWRMVAARARAAVLARELAAMKRAGDGVAPVPIPPPIPY
ncbi:MAG: LapA family protein [Alphaproteobacteria bacterium]|nr:LapA family protein [Alphaproteobacteria bacterium]